MESLCLFRGGMAAPSSPGVAGSGQNMVVVAEPQLVGAPMRPERQREAGAPHQRLLLRTSGQEPGTT